MAVRQRRSRRDPAWVLTVLVGTAALAVTGLMIGSRLLLPAERAVIPTEQWPWRSDGVGVEPDEVGSPFQPGDVVVALDGRPLADWTREALGPPWLLGAPARPAALHVTLERAGARIDLVVPLEAFPADRIRGAPIGLILYGSIALVLALVLIVNRPQATALRLLFVGVCCNTADIVAWEFDLQPSDLVLRTPFLYGFGLAAIGNVIFWSCLLHLLSIYPVRSRLVLERPRIVGLIYVGPLAALGVGAAVAALAGGTALDWMARMASVVGAVASAMVAVILASIVAGYRRTPVARRRQVRILAASLGLAAAGTLVLTTLPIALTARPLVPRTTIALLALPVVAALAIAVIRGRLFQVDLLASSRRRLVAAREEERRRLRRDLHDGLGPSLAALGLRIDTVRAGTTDPTAADMLGEIRAELRTIVGQVRTIARELRPPTLDTLGLGGAARLAIDALRAPGGPDLRFDDSGLPTSAVLPAAVEVAAYRIVVEAVTNAVRHASATVCTTTLWIDDDGLQIRVDDDGRGVGADNIGVGSRSMIERAAEVGSELVVEPMRPQGTSVRAAIPLGRRERPVPAAGEAATSPTAAVAVSAPGTSAPPGLEP